MAIPRPEARTLLALAATLLAGIGASPSGAQRANPAAGRPAYRYTYGGAGARQLSNVQITHRTLQAAVKTMESALPIYDGNRHRAIELARMAERELREAANGAPSGVAPGAAHVKRLTATERAARIPKRPEIATARYTAQQIQASNARMQQGMQLLERGIQQLQSLGRDPGNHVGDAVEFAGMSAQAANRGLQFLSSRR